MKKNALLIFINLILINSLCYSHQSKDSAIVSNDTIKSIVPINQEVFVESANTKLYLKLKGQDRTKPVILFLHGGPGDIFLGLLSFEVYAGKELEKDFVVAYLHQRGMGNSPAIADSTQTIKNHVNDVGNVVDYLTKEFDTPKISLMGHSWGGLLGFYYLIEDDSKIDRFITVASPINMEKTNRRSHEETLKWAKAENNTNAITNLTEKAMPPYNFEKQLIKNSWAGQAGGNIGKNFSFQRIVTETEFKEFKKEWQIAQMNVIKAMFDEINSSNIESQMNNTKVPVLFIAGRNDTYVTASCVEEAFSLYQSKKELKVFENSHHLVYVDEPELFVQTIRDFITK